MNAISQRNARRGLDVPRALPRVLVTMFGEVRQDAWRDKLNACRTALADRDAAIEAAWREHAGQGRERAYLDAQAAYDAAIATARDVYEATTEAAWNDFDQTRKAA